MSEKTAYVFLGVAAVAGVWYLHKTPSMKASVPAGGGFEARYHLDPTEGVAFGYGQAQSIGPAPASYPSNAFDSLYEDMIHALPVSGSNTPVNTSTSAYKYNAFQNANLTQKEQGLPYFTGTENGNGDVVVYDPAKQSTYVWDPATNSVVSDG